MFARLVPAVIDPSLAPPGKHTLHAYLPATEPYELWAGLDRRSDEYKRLKQERSKVLWDGALAATSLGGRASVLTRALLASCMRLCRPVHPVAAPAGTRGGKSGLPTPCGCACLAWRLVELLSPPSNADRPCLLLLLSRLLPLAAVRTLIPDIDSRVEVELVGTPLTHQRFLRRSKGSYGPGGCRAAPAGMLGVLRCCAPPLHVRQQVHLHQHLVPITLSKPAFLLELLLSASIFVCAVCLRLHASMPCPAVLFSHPRRRGLDPLARNPSKRPVLLRRLCIPRCGCCPSLIGGQ